MDLAGVAPIGNLEQLIHGLREASRLWPYTVSWLDASAPERQLGRGILIAGRWAEPAEIGAIRPARELKVAVPFDLPNRALSPWTVRGFNQGYWTAHGAAVKQRVVDPNSFFYPLDAIRHWNKLYGRSGVIQYQSVLPFENAVEGFSKQLHAIRLMGACAPLVVVKDCAAEGRGMLSFPRPGLSIAFDIPAGSGNVGPLVARLNEITLLAGGRIYLTKDALTKPEHLVAMEPRLAAFSAVREKWDPDRNMRSALSIRLLGDPE